MHFLPLQKYRLVAFWNLPNQPSSFLPSFWVEIWADSPVLEEEGTKAAGTVSLCTPEDSMVFQGPPLLPHQPPAPLSLLPWEGEHPGRANIVCCSPFFLGRAPPLVTPCAAAIHPCQPVTSAAPVSGMSVPTHLTLKVVPSPPLGFS